MSLFSANLFFRYTFVVYWILFLTCSGATNAFVYPKASTFTIPRTLHRIPNYPSAPNTIEASLSNRPALLLHPMMIPCDDTTILSTTQLLSVDIETTAASSLSILRTILTVLGGIVLAGGLLTVFTVTFVVPQAAAKLEEDTKRLRPDLWAEYQGKLQDGETMEMRPDILQELGEIMKPIVMADYERQAMGGNNRVGGDDGIVDVDIESSDSKTDADKKASGLGNDQWKD